MGNFLIFRLYYFKLGKNSDGSDTKSIKVF